MDVDRTENVAGEIGQSGRTRSHEPEEGGGALFQLPLGNQALKGFKEKRDRIQFTV